MGMGLPHKARRSGARKGRMVPGASGLCVREEQRGIVCLIQCSFLSGPGWDSVTVGAVVRLILVLSPPSPRTPEWPAHRAVYPRGKSILYSALG